MKITFLGVGEACDQYHPNTSILARAESEGTRIMLDCGFTVPHRYFLDDPGPDDLDGVWITHLHGDHYFGLPLLCLRLWEMARSKPLTVYLPIGGRQQVQTVFAAAYGSLWEKLQYPIHYVEVEKDRDYSLGGIALRAAPGDHSKAVNTVRLKTAGAALFYSGDGCPTEETLGLADGVDLIIHEAFRMRGETPGHGTVQGCIEFARQAGVKNLALVHMQREERIDAENNFELLTKGVSNIKIMLPRTGDQFLLQCSNIKVIHV